jgi:flagellin-like protein
MRLTADTLSDRAVSPVIGVILMVAITVILAAVIGAFVLEIGDQQETAPNTSFDSEQYVSNHKDFAHPSQGGSTASSQANLTTVEITHAGGDTLDIQSNEIKLNGNASTWGANNRSGREALPQPDLRAALGTNDPVSFTSGQSWNAIGAEGLNREYVNSNAKYRFEFDTNDNSVYLTSIGGTGHSNSNYDGESTWNDNTADFGELTTLSTGDNVNVVWTASSGGKTQAIFKYTVQ